MKKTIKIAAVVIVIAALFGGAVYAGTSYDRYNTTVGRFNGAGYSQYQTKAVGGANGFISSASVGGSYTVDARMNSSKGNGAWLRSVNDGTKAGLPGNAKQTAGTSVRVQFSNDLLTPVNVQVEGYWKSN